jgi:hypothetical protein
VYVYGHAHPFLEAQKRSWKLAAVGHDGDNSLRGQFNRLRCEVSV